MLNVNIVKKNRTLTLCPLVERYSDAVITDDSPNVEQRIKSEPMFHAADWDFVHKNTTKDSLTRRVLDKWKRKALPEILHSEDMTLDPDDYYVQIDTKSVMLMKGQYPCIPGWHLDGVQRDDTGQPDLTAVSCDAHHFIFVISSGFNVSRTEFVTSDVDLNPDKYDTKAFTNRNKSVWGEFNEDIESRQYKQTRYIDENHIYAFNQAAPHRGTAATGNGWRYFFRMSFYPKGEGFEDPVQNNIRNQVQVYADPNKGW